MQIDDNEDPQESFNRFDTALCELKAASDQQIPETRQSITYYLCLPDSYNGFIDTLNFLSDANKNVDSIEGQIMANTIVELKVMIYMKLILHPYSEWSKEMLVIEAVKYE